MTISTTTNQATATGDGSSVAFPFPGPFIVPADLKVYLAGVLQTAGYTVTGSIDVGGSGAYSSGTITFAAAPAVGVQVLIYCDPDLLQSTSFPPNNPFPAKTMEKAVDKLTLQVQRVKGAQTASLFFPAGDSTSGQLPAKAARLNTISGFDANGAPTAIPFGLGNFTGTVSSSALREKQTATAAQTAFALASIAVAIGAVQVFVDGFELPASDITVNSPTSVTISSPLRAGQQVEFVTNTFSTFGSGKATLTHVSTSTTDVGSLNVQRTASMAGGTVGFVSSAVRADTYVSAGVTSFEWAGTFVVHNYATAGENVGVYGQGLKYSTGPTWGGTMEAVDWTGQADPTTGLVGLEVDCRANGTDGNHSRVGVDLVVTRPYVSGALSGAAMQAWYGYRVQNGGDANAAVVASFSTIVSSGVVGFDCSGATLSQGSLKMASGQPILFTAAADRKLYYDGTGFRFSDATNTTIVRFADNGAIQTAGGIQVVGARQTGYAAMTGTPNRAAVYDTSTITLPQLAGRVMAMQADFTLHGLIGT